jgi:hypothetical protein
MAKVKSERHHWWPEAVSKRWAGEDGGTGWITPDGKVKRLRPDALGVIGNAHHIKFSQVLGENTPWDSSFETAFNRADSSFPTVIDWLEGLPREALFDRPLRQRFLPQICQDQKLEILTECVVSLAIRSPRNREAVARTIEHLRGQLEERERNMLIAANMQGSQRLVSDSIKSSAKFAVLFSRGREFIYGDGFFHNVTNPVNRPHYPKFFVPITPHVSVVITRPMQYMVEPKLSTLVLSDEEVVLCNHAVQVYSGCALFYRSEKPDLDDAFKRARHMTYEHPDNPIDTLIRAIPGIPDRDRSHDFLLPEHLR